MNKSKTPLLDGLTGYKEEKIYRFHMPGHYGKLLEPYRAILENPFAYDVTEVPKLDNLAEPDGIIRESLENMAALYGAKKSYLLINGSTSGIHIAIDALVPDGGKILIARNSHKSIHNIARRKGLEVSYLFPEIDPVFSVDSHLELQEIRRAVEEEEQAHGGGNRDERVREESVEKASDHELLNRKKEIAAREDDLMTQAVFAERQKDQQQIEKGTADKEPQYRSNGRIAAVVLTYPNYYGRAYDLPAIYHFLKSKGILLIVDSAHGASFEFSEELPISAVRCSDVCIHSLHKTLPALTQVSALHLGEAVSNENIQAIEQSLQLYLSTSPSYLLMLSAELALHIMDTEGRSKLPLLRKNVERIKRSLAAHPHINIYDSELPSDFGKLLLQTPIRGEELSKLLREKYRIQCEMTLGNSILFMLGMVHETEELDYLAHAVIESVDLLCDKERKQSASGRFSSEKNHLATLNFLPRLKKLPKEQTKKLDLSDVVELPLEAAAGKVAAEDFTPYPPGIPVVVKYEILTEEALELMAHLGKESVRIFGF